MKAAQNPIQSLQTFGRHYYGGSIAALPLVISMPLQTILPVLFLIFIRVCPVVAQQHDTNLQATDLEATNNIEITDEKRLDLLFDRIMDALPDGERGKVDSATSREFTHRNQNTEPLMVKRERESESTPHQARMGELPEEIKTQVERAIMEMELRKEERKAQFRESRRNR